MDSALILPEQQWRKRPAHSVASRVALSQWRRDQVPEPLRVCQEQPCADQVITLAVRRTSVEFKSGKRLLRRGRIGPEAAMITGPGGDALNCVFYGSYHMIRAFIPQDIIRECVEELPRMQRAGGRVLPHAIISSDPALLDLMRSALDSDAVEESLIDAYLDGIGLALASRLAALATTGDGSSTGARNFAKLARAAALVDRYFDGPLPLDLLCDAASMSRGQFTREFKAAYGLSPHQYIIARRIAAAKQLLRDGEEPIVAIAAATGFSSQSHLSAVFQRLVGETPRRWRQQQARSDGADSAESRT